MLIFWCLFVWSCFQCSWAEFSPQNLAQANYLVNYPHAKCLDGSPGHLFKKFFSIVTNYLINVLICTGYYYFRQAEPGTVNSTKFIIHIQG